MKRARFADPARHELLGEVAYYEAKEPGLGGRFLAAVEEATERLEPSPIPSQAHRLQRVRDECS